MFITARSLIVFSVSIVNVIIGIICWYRCLLEVLMIRSETRVRTRKREYWTMGIYISVSVYPIYLVWNHGRKNDHRYYYIQSTETCTHYVFYTSETHTVHFKLRESGETKLRTYPNETLRRATAELLHGGRVSCAAEIFGNFPDRKQSSPELRWVCDILECS